MKRDKKERRARKGGRFFQSLQSRYLLIILSAFLFVPIVFPVATILYYLLGVFVQQQDMQELKYGNTSQIEQMFHQQAAELSGASNQHISDTMHKLRERYPDASFFWVDGEGETKLELGGQIELPAIWSNEDSIQFMKEYTGSDTFTVLAFIGDKPLGQGFMAMQLPRSLVQSNTRLIFEAPFYILFLILVFLFFVALSLLFFRHIRRRLLRLQAAMTRQGEEGLPLPVEQEKQDEIGQLEIAFNEMILQLRAGRQREREEEELRKELIANLSHDLRTPMTVMGGQLYTLHKEPLSQSGRETVKQLENKIDTVSSLIENLLSYTLMTSGRYPLELALQDVLRLVRESAASWYPLWEREGLAVDIELPEQPLVWSVDKEGFRRILDNLFQNVVRHAAEGGYIGVAMIQHGEQSALVISDRGPGTQSASKEKGAGIGLAIVHYLVREMGLAWHIDSSAAGTRILIYPEAAADYFLNKI
ncbi:Signal transduction histidine kinase [Paenibacillus algorifonticola]|uniref:histidine kinase n=1 Tax=Paenibacillus algorifonticola TaxID=684063 RepID=A0A1I2D5S4_9BACL|nr:HAMP domain-containing sensor histidine kinase [Paenibacillus algorifonticola]SFE75887.1 Signal transduction histidine kinase [Paenibacillus algorifonticola]